MTSYDRIIRAHFEAINSFTKPEGRSTQPFPLVAYREEEGVLLTWLEETIESLFKTQLPRAHQMLKNVDFYNGLQHLEETSDSHQISARDAMGSYLSSNDVFVMNHARDFVNNKVASLTRFKPKVNVLSWNTSYKDKIAAKFSKRTIDTIFHYNDMAELARVGAFHAATCGEAYLYVDYNKSFGDVQEAEAVTEAGNFGPSLMDYETPSGEKTKLDFKARVGEVEIKALHPWMVFKQQVPSWREVDYVFVIAVKHRDQVAMENPTVDLASTNKQSKQLDGHVFNQLGEGFSSQDLIIEYEFWHRGTQFLDNGYYAKFIDGKLLKRGPNPHSNRLLPVARFTDYDDIKTPHGRSFLQDLRPPLILHNKIMNLMYTNLAIAGRPKLMVPKGTTNISAMAGGGPFVVEYEHGMRPEIVTFQALTNEMFKLGEVFMGQIQQVAGISGLSRGDTIPNARAASILSVYQELEDKRSGVLTDKYVAWIEKIARLALDTAADNYKSEDKRSVRVFGKNNQFKLRDLTSTDSLKGPSDIIIERTTSLAESKQGRIDQIQQLSNLPFRTREGETQTGIFTAEQTLRMIDLGDSDTFMESATAAVDTAESENEDMYEGVFVAPPQKYQAHLVHWVQHYQHMQSKEFSDAASVPEEIRQTFIVHMALHEAQMYEMAQSSLTYCQALMNIKEFPCALTFGPNSGAPEYQLTIAQLMMMHQTPPVPQE
jgi:hypothetical protein